MIASTAGIANGKRMTREVEDDKHVRVIEHVSSRGSSNGAQAQKRRRFMPPSTVMAVPLTKDAPSEARNAASSATSSGRPRRP
jgi:hypothetical protein